MKTNSELLNSIVDGLASQNNDARAEALSALEALCQRAADLEALYTASRTIGRFGFDECDIYGHGDGDEWHEAQDKFYDALKRCHSD